MAGDRKGFSLVELMIATVILAVLTVMGLMVINPQLQFDKARDSRRKGDLGQIKRALLMYHNDEGEYPVDGTIPPVGDEWARPLHPEMVYMKSVPGDPSTGAGYGYQQMDSGQDFCLWTTLQNENDPDNEESLSRCNSSCSSLYGAIIVEDTDYVVCVD